MLNRLDTECIISTLHVLSDCLMETRKRIYTHNNCANQLRRFSRYVCACPWFKPSLVSDLSASRCFKSQTLAFASSGLHGLHCAVGQANKQGAKNISLLATHLFETAGKVRNCSSDTVYTRWMPSSRKPTNRAVDILDSFKLKAHLRRSWTHGRWAYRLLLAHDRNRFFRQGRSEIWLLVSCGGKCTHHVYSICMYKYVCIHKMCTRISWEGLHFGASPGLPGLYLYGWYGCCREACATWSLKSPGSKACAKLCQVHKNAHQSEQVRVWRLQNAQTSLSLSLGSSRMSAFRSLSSAFPP